MQRSTQTIVLALLGSGVLVGAWLDSQREKEEEEKQVQAGGQGGGGSSGPRGFGFFGGFNTRPSGGGTGHGSATAPSARGGFGSTGGGTASS